MDDAGSWSGLHDLGLIYLALMHGADAEIDPAEKEAMVQKLQGWQPETPSARLQRIINDVVLAYVSASGEDLLETSIASLRETMKKPQRIAVLNDLADIAYADGLVAPGEVDFIQQLAREWNVEDEVRQG